jgi:hypothetical protein
MFFFMVANRTASQVMAIFDISYISFRCLQYNVESWLLARAHMIEMVCMQSLDNAPRSRRKSPRVRCVYPPSGLQCNGYWVLYIHNPRVSFWVLIYHLQYSPEYGYRGASL